MELIPPSVGMDDQLSSAVHLHEALLLQPVEQLNPSTPNTSFGFKEWDPEQSVIVQASAEPACTTSSNASVATFCDATFITELMECDFEHCHHHHVHEEQPNYAGPLQINVDPVAKPTSSSSQLNTHAHHHATQCHANPATHRVITTHVLEEKNLKQHAHQHGQQLHSTPVFDGIDVEPTILEAIPTETRSLHAHADEQEEQCHGSHDGNDDADIDLTECMCPCQSTHTLPASNLHLQIHDLQADVTKGLHAHSNCHYTPSCSSDGSESDDISLSFPHHFDTTNGGISPASEEGLIKTHSDAEQLTHDEDLREKTYMLNLNLLHLLLACAEAVSEGNLELAGVMLSRLQEVSSEYGSPLQRLSFYLSDALEARFVRSAQEEFRRSLRMPLQPRDMLEAFCVFYNVNPIGKFCHLTLNQLILDNTVSDTHVHLVDLQIGYGMQWAAFLHAVSLRPCGPPKLRLTGIGPSEERLMSTGKKLMDMARTLQVPFEYCPIAVQLQNIDVRIIDLREDEVCVISSLGQLHTLLHKGNACVDGFLAGLKSMEPKVLVVAENDVNHNNPLFLSRFVECLKYYAAVFESLDAALPSMSQARLKMERMLCGPKIGSIVAWEGIERHETMHDWMKRLERAGFRNAQLTGTAITQAKLLLNLYYPNGYSLTEDDGALTLRWNGVALMAIGIWH